MNSTRISVVIVVAALALAMLVSPPAWAASVSGVITDGSNKPVQGMTVIAQNQAGHPVQSAISGANGAYAMSDLKTGDYRLTLDPGKLGFKAGAPVAAFVSDKGLTVNWVVSASAEPIALAHPGSADQLAAADPFGFTWPGFLMFGGLVTAGLGGVVGGVAAAGGFSGSGGGGVASSSK